MSARRGAAVLLLLGASGGCGGPRGAPSAATPADFAETSVCAAYVELDDVDTAIGLRRAATGGVGALARLDETLAALRVAERRFARVTEAEGTELRRAFGALATSLREERQQRVEALAAAHDAEGRTSAWLAKAARCKDVDQRDPSRSLAEIDEAAAHGVDPASLPIDAADTKAREERRRRNLTTLASSSCAPAVRLWASLRGMDRSAALSVAGVATHIAELGLDGERATIRDALVPLLRTEAEGLRAMARLDSSEPGASDSAQTRIESLQEQLQSRYRAVRGRCVGAMPPSPRLIGSSLDPRRATVNVRPRWPDALAGLEGGGDRGFGSGFLVRWRPRGGAAETWVVTNQHVMDDADEADIVSAGMARDPKNKPWRAVVVRRDLNDDVAILRLEPPAQQELAAGLSFRLRPAVEQESVVAAGFPGIGARASFQVTRGVVSNATFGEGQGASAATSYLQHTAPIDPGNSGGPLLDADGALLGMNTLKIRGRENVGLAIPSARVQMALLRADAPLGFEVEQAEAACNLAVEALASTTPSAAGVQRFGLPLFTSLESTWRGRDAAAFRNPALMQASSPVQAARLRAYSAVKAVLAPEHGVAVYTRCHDVHALAGEARYEARFASRERDHVVVLAEEAGLLRAVELR